jgi:hypothetical protein
VGFPSILIEISGIEIEIRGTNKTIPVRSKSVTHRIGDYDKKLKAEEKFKTSQTYWDYSILHGKKISFNFLDY